MKDDTREELERLEKELLSEDVETEEETPAVSDETVFFTPIQIPKEDGTEAPVLLGQTMAIPAFDDPDTIHEPEEPLVYRNFSNDYGQIPAEPIKTGFWAGVSRDDRIAIGLMIACSVLCLGIIGVLVYWLVAYL